jgi:hypothetical protein
MAGDSMKTKNDLSLKRLYTHGTAINLSMAALLVGSLYYNAEMWVNDYPPDIKEKFGPRSERATKQAQFLAIPFLLILIGGVVASNLKLKGEYEGRLPVKAAFLNAYLLFLSFWLFDLTILDWLFFVKLRPEFIVLPGTEGMAGYEDYCFHLKVALPALVWMAVPAFFIALFTAGMS